MAVWQFKVCLIPQSCFNTNEIDVSRFYDADGNYDTSFAWKNRPVNDVKDEIIKAEYELLYNDKYENEKRLIKPNTYIERKEISKEQSIIPFIQTDTNKIEVVAITETEAKNKEKYYSLTAKELVEKFKASKVAEGVKDLNR